MTCIAFETKAAQHVSHGTSLVMVRDSSYGGDRDSAHRLVVLNTIVSLTSGRCRRPLREHYHQDRATQDDLPLDPCESG